MVEIVRERHNQGETYGEIAASYGLERQQVKSLMERQRRNDCWQLDTFRVPRDAPAKNRPAKKKKQHNELAKLRMQVELLRNFLSEAGRRLTIKSQEVRGKNPPGERGDEESGSIQEAERSFS